MLPCTFDNFPEVARRRTSIRRDGVTLGANRFHQPDGEKRDRGFSLPATLRETTPAIPSADEVRTSVTA